MPASTKKAGRNKTGRAPRASVTFPPDLYQTLEDIARKKKVSIAWVVRDAAEKYVALDQTPESTNPTTVIPRRPRPGKEGVDT